MVLFCVGCSSYRPERIFVKVSGNRKICKSCDDNRKRRTGLLKRKRKVIFDLEAKIHRLAIEDHQAYLKEQE